MKQLLATTFLLMLTVVVQADGSSLFFAGVDALPPEQRFRQLSLMLMVSDGADESMIKALSEQLGGSETDAGNQGPADFNFDDYTTPLIRIVDQKSMLEAATRLFRFTRDHTAGIVERLRLLQEQHSDSPEPFPGYAISEDAIIIRNAIADSIDYAVATYSETTKGTSLAQGYRTRTTFLRNNLEYELFAADLDRITNDAIAAVGGRTEAYERMFDDEVDAAAINKKIEAAEYAYGWDRKFDKRAAKMAEEILNNIWDREAQVDP